MYPRNPLSEELQRMVAEDQAKVEANPELVDFSEKEFIAFKGKFKALAKTYGKKQVGDAFMEEDLDFKADLAELLETWENRLPRDTPFQRGCIYGLKCLKSLLEKIEELRPKE